MVRQLFRWFNREFNGLQEAAILLGLASLASQLLGLGRDRLLAARFGAGAELVIYYAAFRVPDLLYVSLGSFISAGIIIPFVVRYLTAGDRVATQAFFSRLLSVFGLAMILASAVAYWLMPRLGPLVVPGFDAAATAAWVALARVILWSPLLLGLSNLLGSFTQSLRKFFIFALSPLFYNLGIIGGILFFYPRFGLVGLAWGVALGAALHLAIQLPTLFHHDLRPRLTLAFDWRELRQLFAISLPRTLALSASQLVTMVLVAFASLLAAGSIAVFNFAFALQSIPLAIIGVSYSVAAFPTLARLFSAGERADFVAYLSRAAGSILFWTLPLAALLIVLRAQIVRVVLGAGRFSWTDTRLTAAALALFAVSVAAQCLSLLFIRGYYAGGQTKKPLLINLVSSAVTVGLALSVGYWLPGLPFGRQFWGALVRVDEVAGATVLALPLVFSIGAILNAVWFWFAFERDFGSYPATLLATGRQSLLGAFFAGLAAYLTLRVLALPLDTATLVGIFSQGFLAGLVGLAVNFGWLYWRGNHELNELWLALRHRFWLAKPLSPEMPEL